MAIGVSACPDRYPAGLDFELVDLTGVPLDELRRLTTPALREALNRAYAVAEFNTGNELQLQRE